jgi:predicted NUDIX family phosphoesterase
VNSARVLVITTRENAGLIDEEITPWSALELPQEYCFQPRVAVEEDEQWLQIIPYVVLRNQQGRILAYARRGGDQRLLGRRSIGVGGHIEEGDQQETLLDTALNCARRELAEELVHSEHALINAEPLGWIHERETAIGRVHVGLVLIADWPADEPPAPKPDEPLAAVGFRSPTDVLADDRLERWSHLAVLLMMASGKLAAADGTD